MTSELRSRLSFNWFHEFTKSRCSPFAAASSRWHDAGAVLRRSGSQVRRVGTHRLAMRQFLERNKLAMRQFLERNNLAMRQFLERNNMDRTTLEQTWLYLFFFAAITLELVLKVYQIAGYWTYMWDLAMAICGSAYMAVPLVQGLPPHEPRSATPQEGALDHEKGAASEKRERERRQIMTARVRAVP